MKSQIAVFALVLLCGALAVESSPAVAFIQSKATQTLKKYLTQTNVDTLDSSNSMTCFNYYIPLLNGITETYQANYEACITAANAEIEELDEHGAESRENITATANNICSNIDACEAKSVNLDFFDCVAEEDSDVRSLYGASQDASEAAIYLREELRTIQIQSEKCTNETQRVYVVDTASTYDELDDCLANGFKGNDAPTDEPATDAPATDAPQTEAPIDNPTDEADPVEELISSDKSIRSRLQNFANNLGQRAA